MAFPLAVLATSILAAESVKGTVKSGSVCEIVALIDGKGEVKASGGFIATPGECVMLSDSATGGLVYGQCLVPTAKTVEPKLPSDVLKSADSMSNSKKELRAGTGEPTGRIAEIARKAEQDAAESSLKSRTEADLRADQAQRLSAQAAAVAQKAAQDAAAARALEDQRARELAVR